MDLSYQEKSILGSLLATVVVYGYYFVGALRSIGEGDLSSVHLGRLIFAVVAIIAIQIVYHIVLSVEGGVERKDERDILIECKAYRNGYFSLATGAFLVIGCVIMAALAGDPAGTRITVTPFLIVNLVLLFMVLAELVKLLTQLFYYRRGF
jgi:hypothetical protein